jgi:C-terminal processing protease CtpA/Prc
VQYFERAVFEMHPENVGTPYEVLLSQLGRFQYQARHTEALSTATATSTAQPTISQLAEAYLQEAFDYIQYTSILRDTADWATLRKAAMNIARDAQSTSDTYPAIDMVLASFNDAHCVLFRPGEQPAGEPVSRRLGIFVWYQDRTVTRIEAGSLGERAGVQVGDVVEQINGMPPGGMSASRFFSQLYGGSNVVLTLSRPNEAELLEVNIVHEYLDVSSIPSGRRLEGDIGYINIPPDDPLEAYAEDGFSNLGSIGQQIVQDIDSTGTQPIRGWVVDLQLDRGGSVSPMVLAVGSILGDGYLGGYVDVEGRVTGWVLRNGQYFWVNTVAQQAPVEQLIRWVDRPYTLKQTLPPVAVLIGRRTASAGEATLISFMGRANTRTFGQPTSGIPNQPTTRTMSDGAVIKVTQGLAMDRTGHIYLYNERIQPHQFIQPNFTVLPGSDDDPVLKSALEWLSIQP